MPFLPAPATTASFNFLPTLNLTALLAGTSITFVVPGTLAFLAALSAVANVPKPIKLMLSPFLRTSSIVSSAASTTFRESFLEI